MKLLSLLSKKKRKKLAKKFLITVSVGAVIVTAAAVAYKLYSDKIKSKVLGRVDINGDGEADAIMLDTTGNGEIDTIILNSDIDE